MLGNWAKNKHKVWWERKEWKIQLSKGQNVKIRENFKEIFFKILNISCIHTMIWCDGIMNVPVHYYIKKNLCVCTWTCFSILLS
jgi:hypothetical protein